LKKGSAAKAVTSFGQTDLCGKGSDVAQSVQTAALRHTRGSENDYRADMMLNSVLVSFAFSSVIFAPDSMSGFPSLIQRMTLGSHCFRTLLTISGMTL
jgi:hypothetical protein